MISKEFEDRLLTQLAPVIEESYETHMTTGPRRNLESDDDKNAGTLHPLGELYEAAGLEPEDRVTTELVEVVHASFQDHIGMYRQQGVDLLPAIQLSGLMNLGTEDNISWYHAKQFAQFQDQPAYVEMLSRWTAEESDHGPLIEKWAEYAGAIPSSEAHRIRVSQIMSGIHVPVDSIISTNAFTDPQEGDTVDAHNALSQLLDPIGRKVMRKLAGHEARHNRMFRRIGEGLYDLDSESIDYALPIEADTHKRFAMPGEQGIPGYGEMALRIAVHVLLRAAYIEQERAAGRIPVILGRTVLLGPDKTLQVVPQAA